MGKRVEEVNSIVETTEKECDKFKWKVEILKISWNINP